jgi:yersiniabactin nonribosomal peptide synthetase
MFVFSCSLNQAPKSGRVPIGAPREPNSVRLSQETSEKDVFEVLASGEIASGYLNPKQTIARSETDRQGVRWWRSGDLVKMDPETGLYFHAGRKDDFVKVNDHNLSLGDLEAALLENPAVIAAAAIAVELNDRLRIVAFVEPNAETAIDKVALLRTLRERLPSYAMPHDIHISTKIPLTRTGKPDRALLRNLAQGKSVPTGEPVSD